MYKKVLIIEDNIPILENTAELLELASYRVLQARNGREGLAQAHLNKPDIILCDILMPELDGYGVLQAISNSPDLQRIPFIFITSKDEPFDRRFGMSLGADDYLVKPYSAEDLLTSIETRLRKVKLYSESRTSGTISIERLLDGRHSVMDINLLPQGFMIKKISKKDRLFSEGDPSIFLYHLVKGKVKMFHTSQCGREYISRIYRDGEIFAYNSLPDCGSYNGSAEALEDSEITLIPKNDFYALLEKNHELCLRFIHYLSEDLSEVKKNLVKLAYCSARKKVAEAILYIGKKYGADENSEIVFPASRRDISSLAGISPESISRNLTDFRTEKLIDVTNGMLRILNHKKMLSLRN